MKKKLPISEKICYGIGDIANGTVLIAVTVYFLKYLTDIVKLQPKYAGMAMMIGRIWDAITDPAMGWVTDHTKSRWGQRRPYLLFGSIPYALAFLSLWIVPQFSDQVELFAYVTFALLIFNTTVTIVFVPYTSLTAAMTEDYTERTSVTGYRITCSQMAMFFGAVFPSILIPWSMTEQGQRIISAFGLNFILGSWFGTARGGHVLMAMSFCIIIVASLLTAFWGTRERDVNRSQSNKKRQTALGYATDIAEELQKNRPFRISVTILLLSNSATTFTATMLKYYVEDVLYMGEYLKYVLGLLLAMAALSVPFIWTPLAKKYGKAETYRVAMLAYMPILFGLKFLDEQDSSLIFPVACIAGIFYGAAIMIPWAMIPDVVEHDELKTGKRREGLFYGGTTFSYKFATGLAIYICSYYLGHLGYEPSDTQPREVIEGIKIMVGPAPGCIVAIAALLAFKYPLTEQNHKKIRMMLEKRQKETKGKLLRDGESDQ